MSRRTPLLALVLALLLGLVSACGGSSGGGAKTASVPDRLSAAQKFLDDAKGLTLSLSTAKLPKGTNGVLKADGVGTQAPAFKGTISVVQNGLSLAVPVIAVDGKVYIQFGGAWRTIKPADFDAPDPATFFTTGGGLSSLVGGVTSPKKGKDVRDGKTVYSTITGSIPGSAVKKIIPSAGAADFDAVFTLDDTDHLVKASVTGPFYSGAEKVTYDFAFSKYGDTETITAP